MIKPTAAQLAHWQRMLDQHSAETAPRLDRIIAALSEVSDEEVATRVRRVMQAVALVDSARAELVRSGRRRSRKERAADALCIELLEQWRALLETFDQLDADMYAVIGGSDEVQRGLAAAVVAEASA